ncbi:phage baseplate assembly protein V [Pseudomonas sp. Marseille-Q8238]
MNDLATLTRLLENLIRFGTIHAVQMKPPRVQVKTGNLTTGWLPWLAVRAGTSKEWCPPTVGEQVILLSPSGQTANGIALTGIYSDANPANGDRADLHRHTYPDGAVIEYDSAANVLRATLPGAAEISAQGDITLHSAGNITLSAAGNVVITGARVDLN